MLVITRKIQEKVYIGNEITVTIVRVKGRAVRLGIEAPDHIRVIRSELSEADALRAEAAQKHATAPPEVKATHGLHDRVNKLASRQSSLEKPVDGQAAISGPTADGFVDPTRVRKQRRMGPSALRCMWGRG